MPTYLDYHIGDWVEVVIDPPDTNVNEMEARVGERGKILHITPASAYLTLDVDGVLKEVMDYRVRKVEK